MVEVFKTNVTSHRQAAELLELIHQNFRGHKATFDLEDCDRILRIKTLSITVDTSSLISFLQTAGCEAQVLPDDCPPADWIQVGIGFTYKKHREAKGYICNHCV
jgi:hypothetical protein